MLLRLQKYSLTVVYYADPKLFLADFLSRAPIHAGKRNGLTEMFDTKFTIFHVNRLSRVFLSFENVNLCSDIGVTRAKLNLIRHETVNDENLNELRSVNLHGWPDDKHNVPLCIRHYLGFRDELSVCDDVIFKGACIAVPKSVRHLMLKRIHSSHLGAESCLRKARSILFWPQMSHDMKSYVSQCKVCKELKPASTKEPMQFHSLPKRPWSKVALDVFTAFERNYLVTVDYYSDFWEVEELPSTSSFNIISICKRHFARYGIPHEVISDNVAQFTREEFAAFAKSWEFSHTSSPYYCRSNGKAESAVKIAKHLLTKCTKQKEDLWKAILDWRNTPNDSLGTSAAQKRMSRRTKTYISTAETLLRAKVDKEITKAMMNKRLRSKQYYDRVSRTLLELHNEQPVRVRIWGKKWSLGKVIRQVTPRSYLVEVNGQQYRRNRTFIRPTEETPYLHGHCDDVLMPASHDNIDNQVQPQAPALRRSTKIRRRPDRLMYH